jgi:hypothetical protein
MWYQEQWGAFAKHKSSCYCAPRSVHARALAIFDLLILIVTLHMHWTWRATWRRVSDAAAKKTTPASPIPNFSTQKGFIDVCVGVPLRRVISPACTSQLRDCTWRCKVELQLRLQGGVAQRNRVGIGIVIIASGGAAHGLKKARGGRNACGALHDAHACAIGCAISCARPDAARGKRLLQQRI